ncbi:tRNA (adenosine(37)-N6)-threonylcarbamoyltransferase complex dimerization subunit type 1 TsaB [Pseudooceanicola atlanticus]|uniref:tRNA (adenosine(37)-N6)-threonylcarbamoyltransferase complex dimerization subunit type 1 TsaB n=1 Tax=Pseudooceanicola atlanticus TaxID=1461694 RepID=UPI0023534D97|nr:tRNA (adenosine(37)-N6)-threonylcarbamoyltransferase complex dimerization subunit type 1 TsaB [Pseudooceanicola atlanticus]
MANDPIILAFDTSAAHVAVAVLRGDAVLASHAEPMARGQAEHLFPMIEQVLDAAGTPLNAVDRIGVGIGPGNFTGIRISVAAARGLALSLDRPAIGVSTFDAIRLEAPDALAAVPAPRDMAHILRPGTDQAEMVPADTVPDAVLPPEAAQLAIAIARCAAQADPASAPAPAPMYLRPADAAPPRDAPPEIIP